MDKIAKSVKDNNYYGAAITDDGVLYGLPSFINTMESVNKKIIPAIEIMIDDVRVSIYAPNEDSYRNLLLISTYVQKGMFDYNSLSTLPGLIGVIETNYGTVKEEFLKPDIDHEFIVYLNKIAKLFSEFYLGIEVTSRDEMKLANKIRNFAASHSYECVAFPRISYQKKEDAITLLIVDAITNDTKLEEKSLDGQLYFMSEEDYQKIYTKAELANTIKIVSSSTFNFHEKRGRILSFPVSNSAEYLRDLCETSLAQKSLDNNQIYVDRMNYELQTIIDMGYADYFLIVQDYVHYAKTHDILVGPGRGSAAGSLVSYLLDITLIDPIKYGLQFERFLNKGRRTMPDIDVDFMDIKRNLMVDYMREKYGNDKVANIITYQTIKCKKAMQDAARVYNFPEWVAKNLSKTIPNKLFISDDEEEENGDEEEEKTEKKDFTLRDAYKNIPAFRTLVDSDKYYLDLVTLASKIEGLPRQKGMHTAGIVLNDFPLEEAIPICVDLSGNYISQYDMHYIEEQGLLKMDFLSLRNLRIIDYCLKLIEHNHGIKIDPYNIPFNTPETYQVISSGNTAGLFQIDTAVMRKGIAVLKPQNFNDVIVLISINRPGAMGQIPKYINRKAGKEKVNYLNDKLKAILEETYGILVYQEQINSLAQVMAGLSLSEADLFRRGVAKKDSKILKEMESKFISGCIKNGYSEKQATGTFQAIYKFAGYGFNKSHAVVYAYIVSEMAYLKAKYPLEFYASALEHNTTTNDSKFTNYVSEMNTFGIKVTLPYINKVGYTFKICGNTIVCPLSQIKNVENNTIKAVMHELEKSPFVDFIDFVNRLVPYKVNATQFEILVDAGCFDEFDQNRATCRATIGRAMQYGMLNYGEDGQILLDNTYIKPPSYIIEEDNPLENLYKEYAVLGTMLSGNPLALKREGLNKKGVLTINQMLESESKFTSIAGIIKEKKIINTKKGSTMAFITIFDETGTQKVTIFSKVYEETISLLMTGNMVVIEGFLDDKNGETTYVANKLEGLEE